MVNKSSTWFMVFIGYKGFLLMPIKMTTKILWLVVKPGIDIYKIDYLCFPSTSVLYHFINHLLVRFFDTYNYIALFKY